MDLFALPPVAALLDLVSTGLMAVIAFLTPVAGPLAAGFSVVLITLGVRMLLIPVGIAQARAEQARSRLAPRLQVLRQRHRTDPDRLRRETMALYREEGVSPSAGCLPLVLQAPVVGLVYAAFLHASIAGHGNPLLDQTLLGVPLGRSFVGAVLAQQLDAATAIVIGVVVIVIAVVGELTRRLLLPSADARSSVAAAHPVVGALQFATAVVALFVPLAAAVYLMTTAAWTLGQRLIRRRRYPPFSAPR